MLKRKSLYESLKAARSNSSSTAARSAATSASVSPSPPTPTPPSPAESGSKSKKRSRGSKQFQRSQEQQHERLAETEQSEKTVPRKRSKGVNGSANGIGARTSGKDSAADHEALSDNENENDNDNDNEDVSSMLLSDDDVDSDDEFPSSSSSSSSSVSSASVDGTELSRYVNKQRVLILSSRGIRQQERHLLGDLVDLLPHSKKESKLDSKKKQTLSVELNELAELRRCNKVIFLETRKKSDVYVWFAQTPQGPSIKFLLQNVHTMAEVKLTGNALKGSRPFLLFDAAFDSNAANQLMKAMIIQIFGTPKAHPKSKPFFDHIFAFFLADDRIWFRNYQVVYNPPDKPSGSGPMLVEIGPRLVLQPIKIFAKPFGGASLWTNARYQSPNAIRRIAKAGKSSEYAQRIAQKALTLQARNFAQTMSTQQKSEIDSVFQHKDDSEHDTQKQEENENKQHKHKRHAVQAGGQQREAEEAEEMDNEDDVVENEK